VDIVVASNWLVRILLYDEEERASFLGSISPSSHGHGKKYYEIFRHGLAVPAAGLYCSHGDISLAYITLGVFFLCVIASKR